MTKTKHTISQLQIVSSSRAAGSVSQGSLFTVWEGLLPRDVLAFTQRNVGIWPLPELPIEEKDAFANPPLWPPDYGFTVINKDYVLSQWPKYTGLSLVGFEDGAIESYPEGCQDISILAGESARRHF